MIRRYALALSTASLVIAVFLPGCGSEVTGGGASDPCGSEKDGVAIDCFPVCEYGGSTRQAGESFPALDGCNTCTCFEDSTVACTELACAEGCEYAGQLYGTGESFPAGDGCNTCTCEVGGFVSCTLAVCGVCSYNGQSYVPGDVFPAGDGCNSCTCLDDGSVACTDMACACDPAAEWWRDYVGMSPEECALIDFGCPPNTTGFENACGCGCEQSKDCPQFFDCMPPNPCDVQKIKEQCPYSEIAF